MQTDNYCKTIANIERQMASNLNPYDYEMRRGIKRRIQRIAGHRVSVGRNALTGQRFLMEWTSSLRPVAIPLDLAAMAAGQDSWMRQVDARCDCGAQYKLGESDTGLFCPTCESEPVE